MDAIDQQMAEMERKSSELVKNLDATSAQLDASDRASRERIESAAALLEKQAEMLRRKSMEQLDEQIRQYEAKVAKGERGDTPSKLASLKREMSRSCSPLARPSRAASAAFSNAYRESACSCVVVGCRWPPWPPPR